MRSGVRIGLAATGLLAALAAAGCAGSDYNAGAPPATTVVSPPRTFTQVSTPPPTTTTHSGATPECKSSGLKLILGTGDAGMSKTMRQLVFTNTGSSPCVMVGFPGVSYVAGDSGAQVGAAATRSDPIGAQVTLAPGQVASSLVSAVDPGVFDPAACKPTTVRGFRVYPPDETASMYVAVPGQVEGCAGTPPDPQLTVATMRPGPGQA